MNHLVILGKQHLLSCDIDSDNVFLRSRENDLIITGKHNLALVLKKTKRCHREKWGLNPLDSWLFRASEVYHSDPVVMWTVTVEISIFKKY